MSESDFSKTLILEFNLGETLIIEFDFNQSQFFFFLNKSKYSVSDSADQLIISAEFLNATVDISKISNNFLSDSALEN